MPNTPEGSTGHPRYRTRGDPEGILAAARDPAVIRSDKLPSYGPAIRKVFPKTKHLQSEGLSAEINNNLSERLQGSIRDRDKVLRAMKTRESGQNCLDGWAMDYNLFRPHMGLKGKTPAQKAGLDVPFTNWNDVAENVTPITTATRPDWQTQDEHIKADKEFRKMDVATVQEATEPLNRKRPPRDGFRTTRGRF